MAGSENALSECTIINLHSSLFTMNQAMIAIHESYTPIENKYWTSRNYQLYAPAYSRLKSGRWRCRCPVVAVLSFPSTDSTNLTASHVVLDGGPNLFSSKNFSMQRA